MNRLSLDGPVWLASDIHLGAGNPATAELFFEFLDRASAQAGALCLLGDVFDVWIGDDWIQSPPDWLARALKRLATTASKCPLWLGRGNRDFLMGDRLAKAIGAQSLPERVVLTVGAVRVLLAHGDEFCVNDHAYQRFRRIVRHPTAQRLFLALPLNWRARIAQQARVASQQSQQSAAWHAVDADPEAMQSALVAAGAPTLIHGHTHRPSHDRLQSSQAPLERWVLPDWEADHLKATEQPRGGWIVINDLGITAFEVNGTPARHLQQAAV